MSSNALLIVARYSQLVDDGGIEQAMGYLDDDIIYNTWMGVVEGRDNVFTFLKDNVRFMHHSRIFTKWRQVLHTLDPEVQKHTEDSVKNGANLLDSDGYDPQGFAMFERDGKIASRAKYSYYNVRVKETIVLHNNYIVCVNLSKRI